MRLSQVATVPRPSIGAMLWRAVEISLAMRIGASNAASILTSTKVSRKTLSPQCSCTSAELGPARRQHVVNGGQFLEIDRDALGDVLGLRARAPQAHRDELADLAHLVARKRRLLGGLEAGKSGDRDDRFHAVEIGGGENLVAIGLRGYGSPPIFAWASGERTKATSFMPGRRMSPTYWPRPRRKRSSSLRSSEAPTPWPPLFAIALAHRIGVAPIIDAERHHFDRGEIIVDRDIFVVGVHDRRRARAEDHRRRLAVAVEKPCVGGALTAADDRLLAGDLGISSAKPSRRSDDCAEFPRPRRRSRRNARPADGPSSRDPRAAARATCSTRLRLTPS